ncbi:MAG: 4-(cytidine 5'-diphospho)-2-C-methyl-D-erythritol kinase [Peptostreptococcaceae bacterium]|nr:4-(cytidine 5'-diphospho)-2-C-methyl-D-erythritol kinase [Peptostreptococcaceae bacterium]
MKLKARAKINLTLEVLGKRKDNYHNLMMVMQSIDIYDKIEIGIRNSEGIFLDCNKKELMTKDNLAYRAAKIFLEYIKSDVGCDIYIEKAIPMGAGLAGGSTNAAAVLYALNQLTNAKLSEEELMKLALSLGADVPFCLHGGTQFSEGVGERLSKLPDLDFSLLLVKPKESISTAQVFQKLEPSDYSDGEKTKRFIQFSEEKNYHRALQYMCNGLYEKSLSFVPQMSEIIQRMKKDFGCAAAMMSGSGSTVFGIFDNREARRKAYEYFSAIHEDVFETQTAPQSIINEV